ncbi:Retrovirus-related Pol polyprotein from transposon 17.6 [Araneus ventricosus]|uniref:Retrovirus-related Pol polyprotein from transposon 17.6 n=1 Tax=Araneus ventricosus TaxID=182803 RepID=A0A4Y2EMC3_ARAVE|nr:Retrovirus-related Pol polyprotein from transposon 17.6 [Araneus ventricosus]
MPFGLVNAPYFFSKLMAQVLENCDTFAVPYLDDIAIYLDNWEDHLKDVDEVLKRIAPLTHVLKGKIKKERVTWTKECDQAFTELNNRLTEMPVLDAPDYTREFITQTDASDIGIGIVMSQRDEKNEEHPVLYLNKKFMDAQRKYGTTEKECAAIIYAIKKLKYYFDGQNFTIETDQNPLVWLKSNAGTNPRLMRWSLALQPFQYKVIHKAGKKHLNADAFSRSEIGVEG